MSLIFVYHCSRDDVRLVTELVLTSWNEHVQYYSRACESISMHSDSESLSA